MRLCVCGVVGEGGEGGRHHLNACQVYWLRSNISVQVEDNQ